MYYVLIAVVAHVHKFYSKIILLPFKLNLIFQFILFIKVAIKNDLCARFFDVQHVGATLRNFIVLNRPITAQSIFLIYYVTLWFHNALGRNLFEEDTLVFMFMKIY